MNSINSSIISSQLNVGLLLQEYPLAGQLQCELEDLGFNVTPIDQSADYIGKLKQDQPDFLVLDLERTGLDPVQSIRRFSTIPIMMLADQNDETERVLCLELGADDIVLKQLGVREMVARIRAILRRTQSKPATDPNTVRVGPLCMWPGRLQVNWHDQPLPLTSTEFRLLEVLARTAGNVVSKQDLSEQALGKSWHPCDRTVDVHISNIRHKLGRQQDGNDWIQTVRGFGYQWMEG